MELSISYTSICDWAQSIKRKSQGKHRLPAGIVDAWWRSNKVAGYGQQEGLQRTKYTTKEEYFLGWLWTSQCIINLRIEEKIKTGNCCCCMQIHKKNKASVLTQASRTMKQGRTSNFPPYYKVPLIVFLIVINLPHISTDWLKPITSQSSYQLFFF